MQNMSFHFTFTERILACWSITLHDYYTWRQFGFINWGDNKLAIVKGFKAGISSISPLLERIKELWFVCGVINPVDKSKL